MHPVLLEIGPIKLYSYGLMIAIGFLLVLYLMQREAPKWGLDPDLIGELCFWGLFFGVIGTRAAHIIMYSENYAWNDPFGWINITRGGLVFQGAIPTTLLYLYIRLRQKKVSFWPVTDLAMPYIPIAQAFGRFGCFMYGCCYGQRADHLWCAVQFPPESPPYQNHLAHFPEFNPALNPFSYPVHPTQLYSVVLLLGISGLLFLLRKRFASVSGACFAFYFILYGVKRFIVEHYRGDDNPRNLGLDMISNQQVFCLLMILAGAMLFAYLRKRSQTAITG
ncbi:MAG: prolipoprotein diacylglyceryl transferase [Candidatus Hydrogenedentes bacterium]|nr:prolipoprotein diacylglyceryl transferase [Candidatus Hydrogenedentota bacterium]